METIVRANEAGALTLKRLLNGKWKVKNQFSSIENINLIQAIEFLESSGAEPGEVHVAVDNMLRKQHRVAYFGAFGSFMFTTAGE